MSNVNRPSFSANDIVPFSQARAKPSELARNTDYHNPNPW